MRRLISVSTLSATIVFSSLAQAAIAPGDAAVMNAAMATTFVLPRDVRVFHYDPRKAFSGLPNGPIDSADPAVQASAGRLVTEQASEFDLLSKAIYGRDHAGTPMAPNGYYVAMDPVVSRMFGFKDWVLIATTIQAGSRVFEARSEKPFAPPLTLYLKAMGCGATTPRSLVQKFGDDPGCRQGIADITNATGADVLAYWYFSTLLKSCAKVGGRYGTAFVIKNTRALAGDKIAVFGQEIPKYDRVQEERRLINGFYSAVGQDPAAKGMAKIEGATPEEVDTWAREKLYRCHPGVRE